jgi:hypothetical protein
VGNVVEQGKWHEPHVVHSNRNAAMPSDARNIIVSQTNVTSPRVF